MTASEAFVIVVVWFWADGSTRHFVECSRPLMKKSKAKFIVQVFFTKP